MSAFRESGADILRYTVFHCDLIRIGGVRELRSRKTGGAPAGRFNCLLHVHPEIHHIDESLRDAQRLIVPARASEDHRRFAVFEDDGRRERAARALAGHQSVGMIFIEFETIAAAVEDESGASHGDSGTEGGVQAGCHGDAVPILIDDGEIAGIAGVRRFAREVHRQIQGIAHACLRENLVEWNVDKVHIAQIAFAVRICEFRCFDAEVQVVSGIVTERFQVMAFEQVEQDKFSGALAG